MFRPVLLILIIGGVSSNRNDSCAVYVQNQQISLCELHITNGSCGYPIVNPCRRGCNTETLPATTFQIQTDADKDPNSDPDKDVLNMAWNDESLLDYSIQFSRYFSNVSTHVPILCVKLKLKTPINTLSLPVSYKIATAALPVRDKTWRIDVVSADGNTSFTRYYYNPDNRRKTTFQFSTEAVTTVSCGLVNVYIIDNIQFNDYRLTLLDGSYNYITSTTTNNRGASFKVQESGLYSIDIEPEPNCRPIVKDSLCHQPQKSNRIVCECKVTRVRRLVVLKDCDTISDDPENSTTEISHQQTSVDNLVPSTSYVDAKVGSVLVNTATLDTNDFAYLLIAVFCLAVVIMLISVVIFLKRCRNQISATFRPLAAGRHKFSHSDSSQVGLVEPDKLSNGYRDLQILNYTCIVDATTQQAAADTNHNDYDV